MKLRKTSNPDFLRSRQSGPHPQEHEDGSGAEEDVGQPGCREGR